LFIENDKLDISDPYLRIVGYPIVVYNTKLSIYERNPSRMYQSRGTVDKPWVEHFPD
jgi:hypothetical protein